MEDRTSYKIAVIGAGNLGIRIAGEIKMENYSGISRGGAHYFCDH